jgi:hypothetical protein
MVEKQSKTPKKTPKNTQKHPKTHAFPTVLACGKNDFAGDRIDTPPCGSGSGSGSPRVARACIFKKGADIIKNGRKLARKWIEIVKNRRKRVKKGRKMSEFDRSWV